MPDPSVQEFPQMLARARRVKDEVVFDEITVASEAERKTALAQGYFVSRHDAIKALKAPPTPTKSAKGDA